MSSPSEIVVAATCFEDAKKALELGVWMASSGGVALHAKMIMESDMTGWLKVSSQVAVSLTGTRQRGHDVAAAIKRDRSLFRDAVSKAAQRLEGGWDFAEYSGDLEAFLEAESGEGKLVILGFSPLHQISGRVVVLSHDRHKAADLNGIANRIAVNRDLSIEYLFLGQARSGQEVPEVDGNHPVLSEPEVLRNLGTTSTQVVITDPATVRRLGLRNLMLAGRCPVIVA